MTTIKQYAVPDREIIQSQYRELHANRELLMMMEQSNDRLHSQNKQMRDVLDMLKRKDLAEMLGWLVLNSETPLGQLQQMDTEHLMYECVFVIVEALKAS